MKTHPFLRPCLASAALFALGATALQARPFDPQRYLGHLQLREATLVLTEELSGLEVPWDLEVAPDGALWFTQHAGSVSRFDPETGETLRALDSIPDLYHKKSLGLFGMALHPDFESVPHVFLHYPYQKIGDDLREIIKTRLVRYTFDGAKLAAPVTLFDEIPGKSYHNGSRILIADDGTLFLTTGDAGDPESSQDPETLTGKVLRLTLDGSVPEDNPIPGSPVWSLGLRNSQGLAQAPDGILYASDHGPNNDDEINLLRPGANYGWPQVEGFIDTEREKEFSDETPTTEPLFAWTPTIATAGLAYYDNPAVPEWRRSLLLVALKGRALRVLPLSDDGEGIRSEHIYLQKRFGRLRDVAVAPNGDIYLATSNRDWHPRYQPWMYDDLPEGPDRIIRLRVADTLMLRMLSSLEHPVVIEEDPEPLPLLSEDWSFPVSDEELAHGQSLYFTHCAACHRPDGAGAPDLYPPLADTDWVTGDKSRLIQLTLKGLSEPIVVKGKRYEQEMPGFANLSDEDLAAILSYIRKSFGNDASGVIPAEVHEERQALYGIPED